MLYHRNATAAIDFRVMHIDAFTGQVIVLPRVVAILRLNIDFLIYHSFASVSLIKVLEYIADSFCAFTIVDNFM